MKTSREIEAERQKLVKKHKKAKGVEKAKLMRKIKELVIQHRKAMKDEQADEEANVSYGWEEFYDEDYDEDDAGDKSSNPSSANLSDFTKFALIVGAFFLGARYLASRLNGAGNGNAIVAGVRG